MLGPRPMWIYVGAMLVVPCRTCGLSDLHLLRSTLYFSFLLLTFLTLLTWDLLFRTSSVCEVICLQSCVCLDGGVLF